MTESESVPDDVATAVNQAVNRALSEHAANNPLAPRSFLGLPTSVDVGDAKGIVAEALTTVIDALDVVLKFGWLIPDQYEAPLRTLRDALAKVKGWVH